MPYIKSTLEAMLKPYEAQFKPKDEIRGRVINSPHTTLSLYLGTINHYYIRLIKKLFKYFVSGVNMG